HAAAPGGAAPLVRPLVAERAGGIELGVDLGEVRGDAGLAARRSHHLVEALGATLLDAQTAALLAGAGPRPVEAPLGTFELARGLQLLARRAGRLAVPRLGVALLGGELALAAGRRRAGDDRVALAGAQPHPGERLVVLVERLADAVGQV